jgi:isoamylase
VKEQLADEARRSALLLFPGGVNFSVYSRSASGVELVFFDREDDAGARAHHPDRSGDKPDLSLLARFRPRRETGAALWLSRPGAVRSRQPECASIPTRFCWTLTARGVVIPANYSREPRCAPGDNAATALKSVSSIRTYDWEGDTPPAPAGLPNHHLRDARARFHTPSQLRGFGKTAALMPA